MSSHPWPSGAAHVLFLLDARHRVKERLLRDQLTSTRRDSGFTGTAEQVVLNTKGKRDPLKSWESALQADDTGDYASMLLDKMKPLVAHATLLPYVEAYRIVANTVAMQASGTAMNLKDCVAQSLVNGRQAWLQRRISSEASIGKLFFENGYKILDNKGLIDSDDPNIDDRRRQMSQDLRDLARRMRAIRVLAHPGQF